MSEEKTPKTTPNRPGRPKTVISRRKWQETTKCLKQVIGNEKQTVAVRLRAIELYFVLNGLELPDSSRRAQKTVRMMVEERAGERSIHQHIREQVAARVEAEAREQADADRDKMLRDFLRPVDGTDRTETVDAN